MNARSICGYASLFAKPDLAGDEILAGAFGRSISRRSDSLTMLYQHDATRPIGIWTKLQETKRGLWVEGVLADDVQLAHEVSALIRQNVLSGLSIGYRPIKAKPGRGAIRRHLHEIDLVEISIVTFPMQPLAKLYDVPALVGKQTELKPVNAATAAN